MAFQALLIGNWAYQHPDGGMPRLQGPPHDLERMRAALTHGQYGLFDSVDVKQNLTQAELRQVLYEVADETTPNDVLMIYYSGHGERLGQRQQLGLVGTDVPQRRAQALAFNTEELSAWLANARAKSKILVLDCCYSGQYRAGELVDDEVLAGFAQGIYVLASGGNQVVHDQGTDRGPSPFTAALSALLIDEGLAGTDGLLSADDVYDALDRYQPRLPTPPHRNVTARGQFAVARRPRPTPRDAEVVGWPDSLDVVHVLVRLTGDHVVAAWDRDRDGRVTQVERDVSALDPHRLAAVRRLSQLADAVMRAKDYSSAPWQARARRALDTAAANLFETALPPGVRDLLAELADEPHRLVRLDLAFDPPWARLSEYPWEYLHLPSADADSRSPSRRTGLVVTRVASGKVDLKPRRDDGDDEPDVAVLNTFGPPYDRLAERISTEIVAMSRARLVSKPQKEPARWADFMHAIEQGPRYLVICAPLSRESTNEGAVPKMRFRGTDREDWRVLGSLAAELKKVPTLEAVVLLTVAADAGMDSFRASPSAARELNERLGIPVVFVCHTPGLEAYVNRLEGDEPQTFVGLLLTALSLGKDMAESVWYARERVLRYIDEDLVPTFGVPGVVLAAPVSTGQGRTVAAERLPGRAGALARPVGDLP